MPIRDHGIKKVYNSLSEYAHDLTLRENLRAEIRVIDVSSCVEKIAFMLTNTPEPNLDTFVKENPEILELPYDVFNNHLVPINFSGQQWQCVADVMDVGDAWIYCVWKTDDAIIPTGSLVKAHPGNTHHITMSLCL